VAEARDRRLKPSTARRYAASATVASSIGGCDRGANVLLLGCQEYESPFWLSFKQAKELGGSVRKGEKATPVIFWKWLEGHDLNPETGEKETRRVPLLRYFSAFNLSQCDGVRHRRLVEAVEAQPKVFSPIQRAEALVAGYRSAPSITHG
jgi:antirestriction protein ArdC